MFFLKIKNPLVGGSLLLLFLLLCLFYPTLKLKAQDNDQNDQNEQRVNYKEKYSRFIHLSQLTKDYAFYPGVISTPISSKAYEASLQNIPEGKLFFRIKRGNEDCFELNEDLYQCAQSLICSLNTKTNFLTCPLSGYNRNNSKFEVLLENENIPFKIEAVVFYERLITHNKIYEVIDESPLLTLNQILNENEKNKQNEENSTSPEALLHEISSQ